MNYARNGRHRVRVKDYATKVKVSAKVNATRVKVSAKVNAARVRVKVNATRVNPRPLGGGRPPLSNIRDNLRTT